MKQEELWREHDTIYDALGATVAVAGGAKKVAAKLWPALSTEAATTKLRGCLNPDHAQKLCLEEMVLLGKLGRDVGDNSLMNFLGRELTCEVKPLAAAEAKKRARKEKIKWHQAEVSRLLEEAE